MRLVAGKFTQILIIWLEILDRRLKVSFYTKEHALLVNANRVLL